MTLRSRLLLAQAPLALALILLATVGVTTLRWQGQSGQRILADNYRSVLAAERIKEALERMDSAALFVAIGERKRGLAQMARYKPVFEQEFEVQRHNLTEQGEDEATAVLGKRWIEYLKALDDYASQEDPASLKARYREVLEPAFLATKDAADRILALNQDAMVGRSDALRKSSERVNAWMVPVIGLALALGLSASSRLVTRALRPLAVLSQAVRRLGEGDLQARAEVKATGEVGQLARDFNGMAEGLRTYRESSLGELLQVQAASQAAIDSLPDPVMVFDTEDRLLNSNRAAEDKLGIAAERTSTLTELAPELRDTLEPVRAHVLGGKGAWVPKGYEEAIRVESEHGPAFLLPRAEAVYSHAGGTITGVTVVLQDVTRLKRFDELKNDLVATVAHEVRTPLTSLRMAIHLLVEGAAGSLTDKQADLLESAREDTERLQRIVDDLLDLSRIQTGRMVLHLRDVPVERLLEEAVAAHRPLAEDRDIVLTSQRQLDAARARVDEERLGMVLANLVSNAIRHTPDGGHVEVGAVAVDGKIRFEVRDSGPGVDAEHQARIFERYYRIPGAAGGAAGLGLSIARDIVREHGGEIGVESKPGKGSIFWFTVDAP